MKWLHSHSAHEAFDTCPARFELQQKGAPRRPEAQNFLFGRTFHVFAQLYRDHCIAASRWSDVEVVGELVDKAFQITGLSMRHYEELTAICRHFVSYEKIDVERSLMREGGIALDENFQLIPWSDDFEYDSPTFTAAGSRAALRMKLDEVMVDASAYLLIVKDWKTDMHVPSPTDLQDMSRRWWKQAMWYAWGALRYLYPAAIAVQFDFVFVRWNITRTLTISREDVAAFDDILRRRIAVIENTETFVARPGEQCRTCPFLDHGCPLAESLTFDMYKTDVEEIAARFLYDAAVQEQRRDQLQEHAATDGTIVIGALPVAIFEKTEPRRVLDIQKALDVLRSEGIDNPELLLDLSPSKLRDLLDDENLFERVVAAATAKSDDRVVFNVHQKKPELVALATSLGIPDPQKMKVAQLALAIVKASRQQAA
jgi:hypothetical protein